MQPIHIYGLSDPRDGQLRYIGQTSAPKTRYAQHLSLKNKDKKSLWVAELRLLGLKPEMFLIEEITSGEHLVTEQFWINYFRMLGANLLNSRPPTRIKPVYVEEIITTPEQKTASPIPKTKPIEIVKDTAKQSPLTFAKTEKGYHLIPFSDKTLNRLTRIGDNLGMNELAAIRKVLTVYETLLELPEDAEMLVTTKSGQIVFKSPLRLVV